MCFITRVGCREVILYYLLMYYVLTHILAYSVFAIAWRSLACYRVMVQPAKRSQSLIFDWTHPKQTYQNFWQIPGSAIQSCRHKLSKTNVQTTWIIILYFPWSLSKWFVAYSRVLFYNSKGIAPGNHSAYIQLSAPYNV